MDYTPQTYISTDGVTKYAESVKTRCTKRERKLIDIAVAVMVADDKEFARIYDEERNTLAPRVTTAVAKVDKSSAIAYDTVREMDRKTALRAIKQP